MQCKVQDRVNSVKYRKQFCVKCRVTLPAPPSVPNNAGRLRQAPVGRNLPLAGRQQSEMGGEGDQQSGELCSCVECKIQSEQ